MNPKDLSAPIKWKTQDSSPDSELEPVSMNSEPEKLQPPLPHVDWSELERYSSSDRRQVSTLGPMNLRDGPELPVLSIREPDGRETPCLDYGLTEWLYRTTPCAPQYAMTVTRALYTRLWESYSMQLSSMKPIESRTTIQLMPEPPFHLAPPPIGSYSRELLDMANLRTYGPSSISYIPTPLRDIGLS